MKIMGLPHLLKGLKHVCGYLSIYTYVCHVMDLGNPEVTMFKISYLHFLGHCDVIEQPAKPLLYRFLTIRCRRRARTSVKVRKSEKERSALHLELNCRRYASVPYIPGERVFIIDCNIFRPEMCLYKTAWVLFSSTGFHS